LQSVLQQAREQKRAGLSVGILHEASAKLALLAGDSETFEMHAQLTGECYRLLRRPALLARFERLIQGARAAQRASGAEIADWEDPDSATLTDAG
jgi:hypothetical protein